MVKKTVLAIVAVVLLVAVVVGASYRYGGYLPSRHVYTYSPETSYPKFYPYTQTAYPGYTPYLNYPTYVNVYPAYSQPAYQRPSYVYPYYSTVPPNRFGEPLQTYPTYVGVTPRAREGMLCGSVGMGEYSCEFGLFCDYSRTAQPGVGLCSRQA